MKEKSFDKRLTLNKKTISNLNDNQMVGVKAGCVDTIPSCATRDCTWTCPETVFCTFTC